MIMQTPCPSLSVGCAAQQIRVIESRLLQCAAVGQLSADDEDLALLTV